MKKFAWEKKTIFVRKKSNNWFGSELLVVGEFVVGSCCLSLRLFKSFCYWLFPYRLHFERQWFCNFVIDFVFCKFTRTEKTRTSIIFAFHNSHIIEVSWWICQINIFWMKRAFCYDASVKWILNSPSNKHQSSGTYFWFTVYLLAIYFIGKVYFFQLKKQN